MADDSNELVQRLTTAAGIIMEDMSPIAVSVLPEEAEAATTTLAELEQAMRDATILMQAAQTLARRDIR